ncbi:hypothetical protein LTR66_009789 [Elasticomyces elasticus]|nr:hypothetical protein LTR66_009789 [Elasticomyces elasticus]KAK4988167.1 hypothetical protein LTR50_004090 [Elasticomyces elasticus]
MARITLPPLTRSLLAALILCSLLNSALRFRQWSAPPSSGHDQGEDEGGGPSASSWHDTSVPYLVIVPAHSLLYPYTTLTAALVEQNVVSLTATALTVFFGGRYLERAWGGREYAIFLLFVTMIPNLLTFAVYAVYWKLTGNSDVATTTINGGVGICAAFLVAFKQLVPEHTVALASVLRIRVKHFPAIFLLANTLSGPLLGTDTAVFLSWLGFLTAWIYLRFFRISPTDDLEAGNGLLRGVGNARSRGDASDTFAFAQFFPEPVSTILAPPLDIIYNAFVSLRILRPFSGSDIVAGNEQASVRSEGGLQGLMGGRGGRGGGRREEAERRRALALRALDQRLNAAASRPQQQQQHAQMASTPAQVSIVAGPEGTEEGDAGGHTRA